MDQNFDLGGTHCQARMHTCGSVPYVSHLFARRRMFFQGLKAGLYFEKGRSRIKFAD